MKDIILLVLTIIVPVLIIALAYLLLHRNDDIKPMTEKQLNNYVKKTLVESYAKAVEDYQCLVHKLDDVDPAHFDVTYSEMKAAEAKMQSLYGRLKLEHSEGNLKSF